MPPRREPQAAPDLIEPGGLPPLPSSLFSRWMLLVALVFALMLAASALAAAWQPQWPLALALGLVAALGVMRLGRGLACATAPRPTQCSDVAAAPGSAIRPVPVGSAAPSPAPAINEDGDTFAYTVSHDLRAPIRVIEGFTRIVREDYGHLLDRVGNDHLDRVLGAASRMNHMIDALLALTRLSNQTLVRQPVDLSQLAHDVLDELQRQAAPRPVETRIAPAIVADGDPTLLRMVLDNLLGNAWKYSARREPAQIEFGSAEHGGRTVYFVSDNGAGFDMRFADRLFSPFQRLHSASEFQGTGVGLASVQRIIQRHGGEVWAESEVDRGATFYFTLA